MRRPPFEARLDGRDPNACWLWDGHLDKGGYGTTRRRGRRVKTHQLAFEIMRGPVPKGRQLDHTCRTRRCFNPFHLEPVTQRENILRGDGPSAINARKTECPHGHPYDKANTFITKLANGREQRGCRACNRQRSRDNYAKRTGRRAA